MNPDLLMYLLVCTMILLPIVPAYLLFHALPHDNSAEVSGPWQGLNLKLGGAFAGYFVVVLMIFSAYKLVKPKPMFEIWEVKGNITDTAGKDIGPISAQDFSAQPGWLEAPEGGNFHMYVFTRPGPNSTEYPTIYLNHNGHLASFNLDPNQAGSAATPNIVWNKPQHTVSIKDVQFTDPPPYDSSLPVVQLKAAVTVPGAGGK